LRRGADLADADSLRRIFRRASLFNEGWPRQPAHSPPAAWVRRCGDRTRPCPSGSRRRPSSTRRTRPWPTPTGHPSRPGPPWRWSSPPAARAS